MMRAARCKACYGAWARGWRMCFLEPAVATRVSRCCLLPIPTGLKAASAAHLHVFYTSIWQRGLATDALIGDLGGRGQRQPAAGLSAPVMLPALCCQSCCLHSTLMVLWG